MLKKRKWPLKGWHKVRATGSGTERFCCWKNTWETQQLPVKRYRNLKEVPPFHESYPLWASSASMLYISSDVTTFAISITVVFLKYQWKAVAVVSVFELTTLQNTQSHCPAANYEMINYL